MRSWILSIAMMAAAGSGFAAEWKKVTSIEGNYSVLLPGDPHDIVQPSPNKKDVGEQYLKVLPLAGGAGSCMVMHVDYTAELLEKTKTEELLQGARGGLVGDGEIKRDRKVDCCGSQGIELAFIRTINGARTFWRAKVFFVGRRMYQIVVTGTGKPVASENVTRIFESFRLIQARPATASAHLQAKAEENPR